MIFIKFKVRNVPELILGSDLAVGLGHIQTNTFPTLAVTNKELDVRGKSFFIIGLSHSVTSQTETDSDATRHHPLHLDVFPIGHRHAFKRRRRSQSIDH